MDDNSPWLYMQFPSGINFENPKAMGNRVTRR
jgi:hypothetical protein